MRLVVLGNPDRYLAPLAGGTSYLVEHEGARILLDTGPGARDALLARGVDRVDAVWLSHFHFDHVLDLPTLFGIVGAGTPVLFPAGERARLDALALAYAWDGPWAMGAPREVGPTDEVDVGPFHLRFARTQHSAPAMAVSIGTTAGARLVYASDSAPCAPLAELARGADALLLHTLLPHVEEGAEHARIHATARSGAKLAQEVGAGALLLSHRFHASRDEDMLREAPRARLLRPADEVPIRRAGGRPSG